MLPLQPTPNQNGVLKRTHSTLHFMLSNYSTQHRNWPSALDYVASAYNTTINKGTNFSPDYLFCGRQLCSPLAPYLDNPKLDEDKSLGDFMAERLTAMSEAYALVEEGTEKSQRYYNKHVKLQQFVPNYKVLVHNPRRKKGSYHNWNRLYCNCGRNGA